MYGMKRKRSGPPAPLLSRRSKYSMPNGDDSEEDCYLESQNSVFSEDKHYAVYVWIFIKSTANKREVVRVVSKLQDFVDEVSPGDRGDEDDEILAGVGFGSKFYKEICGNAKQDFKYVPWKGKNGDMLMPSTEGDVFIHAKSNTLGKLYDLTRRIMGKIHESVEKFQDIYGFAYRKNRDLSGFIDGTANPKDESKRQSVAVEMETGGSYVITQKWVHNFQEIDKLHRTKEGVAILEKWVGRTLDDSKVLPCKKLAPETHIVRIRGPEFPKREYEIVRQSMPWGTVSGDAGLFFIAYSKTPKSFNFMLSRMVDQKDNHRDDMFKMSKNVEGTYWYFPGVSELQDLA